MSSGVRHAEPWLRLRVRRCKGYAFTGLGSVYFSITNYLPYILPCSLTKYEHAFSRALTILRPCLRFRLRPCFRCVFLSLLSLYLSTLPLGSTSTSTTRYSREPC